MEKLNLTPEQILDTQFEIDFKGYSADQVDSFLDMILEDYQIMEENTQELLNTIESLKQEISSLKRQKIELEGQKRAFDLSNTTNYSSVDMLKRISRLEEQILKR